jgi:hypothetical protein
MRVYPQVRRTDWTQHAKTLNPQAVKIHRRIHQWEKIIWKKESTSEIANKVDVAPSRASLMRRRMAPHTVRKTDPTRWETVDWTLRDCEIARKLGVSRQLVHITRQRKGKAMPKPEPDELNPNDYIEDND